MSDLKTLKDLEHSEDLKHQDSKLVYSWKLRQEAIKWIKEDKESIDNDKEMPQSLRILLNYLTTKWMRRFNITEEDLK